eukprot:GHVS01013167.1.p2 GENE.GHVS01013167.1~~GHVS01013167.1.p2  ORF type:complete len:100 (+),score=9.88 GHVS01013167.1:67-366(+)
MALQVPRNTRHPQSSQSPPPSRCMSGDRATSLLDYIHVCAQMRCVVCVYAHEQLVVICAHTTYIYLYACEYILSAREGLYDMCACACHVVVSYDMCACA